MNPSKSNHADVWEHYTCLHNVEIIHTEKLFKSFLYFFLNILSMWNKKKKKSVLQQSYLMAYFLQWGKKKKINSHRNQ